MFIEKQLENMKLTGAHATKPRLAAFFFPERGCEIPPWKHFNIHIVMPIARANDKPFGSKSKYEPGI